MARFRMVEVRIWSDAKFRSLTPIPPCGQGLWLHLLTCQQTSIIPGVIIAGKLTICDTLKWSPEQFDIPFQELYENGMANADFDARLIWLPNALKYNKPPNENVIIGWKNMWSEVPECELKNTIWTALHEHISEERPQWLDSFYNSCGYGIGNGIGNGMPNKEKEIEIDIDTLSPEHRSGNDTKPSDEKKSSKQKQSQKKTTYSEDFLQFWTAYPRKVGKGDAWKEYQKVKSELPPIGELVSIVERHAETEQWTKDGGQFIPHPSRWFKQRRWEDEVDTKPKIVKPHYTKDY